MHNRLNNRLFSFSYFLFFSICESRKCIFLIPYVNIMLSMYISIYIYLLEWSLVNSRKLNKEHNYPCMFSSSYSSYSEKFDTAAEVCFNNMFKVRCHYFIQEINLLHKEGMPNKSILHCILCWNFEFPLTEAPTMCICRLFWS